MSEVEKIVEDFKDKECQRVGCNNKNTMVQMAQGENFVLCPDHIMEFKEDMAETKEIIPILQNLSGKTIEIKNFKEYKKKTKDKFFNMSTGLTKYEGYNKCEIIPCDNDSVIIGTGRAYCEKHAEFPRACAIESIKERYR